MRRSRNCSSRSKRILPIPHRIAFSPPAMPIWAGSTRRERSSRGCSALTPVVVPNVSTLRNPEHRELYLSGLRLAAGEAT